MKIRGFWKIKETRMTRILINYTFIQARKQGIYKNYIHAAVDGLGTIPVTDEAYDVIVCSNGFAPGDEMPQPTYFCQPSFRSNLTTVCLGYDRIWKYVPGQIYPSAFPEMLRVVRPGGYILIAMKVADDKSVVSI